MKASHYRHSSRIRRKSLVKSSALLTQTLLAIINNQCISTNAWELLYQVELSDSQRAHAFQVSSANVEWVVEQRSLSLRAIYPALKSTGDRLFEDFTPHLSTLWMVWLPLAQRLANQRQQIERPLIQGILGGQGTGKTTLGILLTAILQSLGYQAITWSLDDLYKTYHDRQILQHQEPDLIWRGPPGTHDIDLGIQVLDQLRQPPLNQPILLPRFDKSLQGGLGDRTTPEAVMDIDVVLFEGWFVGVKPIQPEVFDHPPDPIRTEADRTFALKNNERLNAYLPLWERLDSLWVLYVPDYRLSKEWRKQAEHQMKAAGKAGLSDETIDAFVEYFWKALHPEMYIPPTLQQADLILEVGSSHATKKIYRQKHHPN